MTFAKARQNIEQLADAANTHKMARGLDKPEAAARSMLATLDAIYAHTTDEWARNMARRGLEDAKAAGL